jgi:hypothetical protein
MIWAACATLGGSGCGVGFRGFRATAVGFVVIHSQRTAAERTPRMAK